MKLNITHEGWFLFCPIWFDDAMTAPYPKFNLGLLLDAAFAVQQFRNWVLSFIDPDLCGFPFRVREVDRPFQIEIP